MEDNGVRESLVEIAAWRLRSFYFNKFGLICSLELCCSPADLGSALWLCSIDLVVNYDV